VDVVIVDDDAMLVELLGHSLASRGYTSRVVSDGTAAMQLLTGAAPALRGRVGVHDVGLPEHDGLAVLRALARDSVTRTSRVIMLTARSLESEVLQALDLGAFDHVAKPFSVPVLMHRIRRALDDAPLVA
jgi:DNA-binding response OmpR family regulator